MVARLHVSNCSTPVWVAEYTKYCCMELVRVPDEPLKTAAHVVPDGTR